MIAKIEKVNNGYIVTWSLGEETVSEVYQNDLAGEAVALQSALYGILDAIGGAGSRHDEERVRIAIEHGDKFDCPGCPICVKPHEA
jgi:hypothetical protein